MTKLTHRTAFQAIAVGAGVLLISVALSGAETGRTEAYLLERETDNLLHGDVVALGTVEEVIQGARSAVALSVERAMKGPHVDSLRFRPGAHVGAATFREGERVIVFLNWLDVSGERFLRSAGREDKYSVTGDGELAPSNLAGAWKGRSLADFIRDADALLSPRAPEVLYEDSDLVCIVEVAGVREIGGEEHLPRGRRKRVAVLRVLEPIKGETAADTVSVVLPVPIGGIYDFVELDAGEHALVFLNRRDHRYYEVAGGHDGKYRLGDFTTDRVLELIRKVANPSQS